MNKNFALFICIIIFCNSQIYSTGITNNTFLDFVIKQKKLPHEKRKPVYKLVRSVCNDTLQKKTTLYTNFLDDTFDVTLPEGDSLNYHFSYGLSPKVHPTYEKMWQFWHENNPYTKLLKNHSFIWAKAQHKLHGNLKTAEPFFTLEKKYMPHLLMLRSIKKTCSQYKKRYTALVGFAATVTVATQWFKDIIPYSSTALSLSGGMLYYFHNKRNNIAKIENNIDKPLATLEKIHQEIKTITGDIKKKFSKKNTTKRRSLTL